jgi:hypothetical protein
MNLDLGWRVKDSFVTYILATGGTITLLGAATERDGTFLFPAEGRVDDGDAGSVLKFSGGVRFCAHGGLVDAVVDSPWLHIGPAGASLTIAGTEATRTAKDRLELAAVGLQLADIGERNGLEVRLAPAGAVLFDFHYEPGALLAGLHLVPTEFAGGQR